MAKKLTDMVQKARAEASGKGEAKSELKKEAGARKMSATHLKGSAPVFKKAGGKAKGGKCK